VAEANRRPARVPLTVPCDINGTKESIKVPVRNLSLDGIRLVSAGPHAVGDTLKVTLRMPARIGLSAEVRWVKHDAAKDAYAVGCRFVHTEGSRQALKDALQDMAAAIDSAARQVK
jgi:hypothetical protein